MVQFNFSERTIKAKVVYYGPAQSGKTTNLEQIHRLTDPAGAQSLISLNTGQDRTLFFDLLPFSLGTVSGYDFKVQLYTVPGQVQYNATRRVVLAGADAVVFVADSRKSMAKDNQTAFENMKVNLLANRLVPEKVPLVLQWNKRDLPDLLAEDELGRVLNPWNRRALPAVAATGQGVLETFSAIVQDMLVSIAQKYNLREKGLDPDEVPQLVADSFAALIKAAAVKAPKEQPEDAAPAAPGGPAPGAPSPPAATAGPGDHASPARIVMTQVSSTSQVGGLQAGTDAGLVSEELLQRAIKSNVELAETLSTLVQQMNSGLTSILSHAESIGMNPDEAARAESVKMIQTQATRLRQLTGELGDAAAPGKAPGTKPRVAASGAPPPTGPRPSASPRPTAAPPPPRPAPPPPPPAPAAGGLASELSGVVASLRDVLTARAVVVELKVPPDMQPPGVPTDKLRGSVTSLLQGISTLSQGSTAVVRCEKKPVLLRGRDGSEVRRNFLMLAVSHAGVLSPQEQQGVMRGQAAGPLGDACRTVRSMGGFVRFAPLAGGQLESRLFFPA